MSHHYHDPSCESEHSKERSHSGSHHHVHCCCNCHQYHQKYADELLCLADQAWMEVLKEKIKEHIRQSADRYLTELAQFVSDSNHFRWKYRMEEKRTTDDFEENLKAILNKDQRK